MKKIVSLFLIVVGSLMISHGVLADGELYIEQEKILSETEEIELDLDEDGVFEIIELKKKTGSAGYLELSINSFEQSFYKGIYGEDEDGFWVAYPVYEESDDINAIYDRAERVYLIKDGDEISFTKPEVYEKPNMRLKSLSSKYYENPSRATIESKIEIAAKNRGIPSVILKSIAYAESGMKQFVRGDALISFDGGYGVMQVTPSASQIRDGIYDVEKLKYDIDYNIEKGADILLGKWGYALGSRPVIPKIGNSDPNILENWYFTIWAYNGWSRVNNPNDKNSWTKGYAYQDRVLGFAESLFDQKIDIMDPDLLPNSGLPSASESFDSPDSIHKGDLPTFEWGDQLVCREVLNLRDKDRGWKVIGTVGIDDLMYVIEGPYLQNGYNRYLVQFYSSGVLKSGWIAINYGDVVELDFESISNYEKVDFDREAVNKSKIWTIRFNEDLDETNLANKIVIAKIKNNQFYELIKVFPVISKDRQEISLDHLENFNSDFNYAIVFKAGLNGKFGKSMKKGSYFEFEVK